MSGPGTPLAGALGFTPSPRAYVVFLLAASAAYFERVEAEKRRLFRLGYERMASTQPPTSGGSPRVPRGGHTEQSGSAAIIWLPEAGRARIAGRDQM